MTNATPSGRRLIDRPVGRGVRQGFGVPGDSLLGFFEELADRHKGPTGISPALRRLTDGLRRNVQSPPRG